MVVGEQVTSANLKQLLWNKIVANSFWENVSDVFITAAEIIWLLYLCKGSGHYQVDINQQSFLWPYCEVLMETYLSLPTTHSVSALMHLITRTFHMIYLNDCLFKSIFLHAVVAQI